MAPLLIVTESSSEVESHLKAVIEEALAENTGDLFAVGLSGGSLVKVLSTVLPQLKLTAEQWKRWVFYFADERIVKFDDAESTYGAYKSQLLPAVPDIGLNQFIIVDPSLSPQKCAYDYFSKMKRSFHLPLNSSGFPQLDLILLGMGPDGHTASLFPEHPLLNEKGSWIVSIDDSPKPPPKRVTFTLPLINAAKRVAFVATGASKADALEDIFEKKAPLPAGLVKPASGQLIWIVDKGAVAKLSSATVVALTQV